MTALLHYFFLATFTWTLCEAVLIYYLLVKVFGANDRKWLYIYLGLGWGAQDADPVSTCMQASNIVYNINFPVYGYHHNISYFIHMYSCPHPHCDNLCCFEARSLPYQTLI